MMRVAHSQARATATTRWTARAAGQRPSSASPDATPAPHTPRARTRPQSRQTTARSSTHGNPKRVPRPRPPPPAHAAGDDWHARSQPRSDRANRPPARAQASTTPHPATRPAATRRLTGMPLRPCLTCGTLSPRSRCQAHSTGNTSWNGTRDRTAQRRFRQAVMQNAGHQCQATTNGQRCHGTTNLQAHHLQPGDHNPTTGVALCRYHHRLLDPHAR